MRPLSERRRPLRGDGGITTVEWLGMAAIAVIVIAMLLPQIRGSAATLWTSIAGQLTGFFG
jgi:Flp pilus assembly pilin Flp